MSESTTGIVASALAPSPLRALGGIWRLTYPGFFTTRKLLTLAGLLALLFVLTAQNVRPGHTEHFQQWTTGFYLSFLLPAIAFLSAAGAMRDDMNSVAVDYVLTRPIRRPLLIALHYLSQMACLQITSLLALAVLMLVGHLEEIAQLGAMLPHLVLAQVGAIAAFSALGFFCASLTTRYLVLGINYGFFIEFGVGRIPTQISRLSMTHHVAALADPAAADTGLSALYLVGFAIVSVALATAVFSLREFTGSGTAEK